MAVNTMDSGRITRKRVKVSTLISMEANIRAVSSTTRKRVKENTIMAVEKSTKVVGRMVNSTVLEFTITNMELKIVSSITKAN